MRSTRTRLILGTAVSLAFLYIALRDVDWRQFSATIAAARWPYALAAAGIGLLGIGVRAYRWGLMLRSLRRFRLSSLFAAAMIGSLANNVLPARAGDLARAYALGRTEGFPAMSALGAVAFGRIVDVFATLVLVALAMLQPAAPSWMQGVGLALVLINAVLLTLLWLAVRHERQTRRTVTRLLGRLSPRLGSRVDQGLAAVLDGLRASMARRMTLPIIVTTVALMVCVVSAVYCCLPALGIPLGLSTALLTTAAVSVASMIPATPGNVGTVQYACLVGLAAHGVSASTAASYSIVYHATQYLPSTVLGAFYLWRAHLRLSSLVQEARMDQRK